MSAQAEVIAPAAGPIAPLRVGDGALGECRIAGTAALPFAEPFQFSCPAGLSLAEIVEGLFEAGLIERAWEPRLAVFIGDVRFTRESWGHVRPRPGRLVAVRAEPGLEAAVALGSAIVSTIFSWNFVAAIAIQVGLSAFVGAEGPAAQSFEQLKDIDASRNEFAPFRKVPVVLGRFRTFPPHAAKPYTIGEGERVILRMLLGWGVGPLAIDDELLKIGDTPIDEFSGVTVQHRLKPGDPWPTIFPSSVDEDAGPGLVAFGDGWVARTTTADECEQLQVEIAFPEGLIFYSSDGDQKSFSVELRIRYREVGATDWLSFSTGGVATEGHLYTESGRHAKPFRKTYKRTVTAGKYEVAVKRNIADDPGPKGKNAFHWTKLRSFTFEQPVLDDNLAVTAIEIEAGDQLSGVVDLVNGVVTRLAPIWDDEEEEFGAAAESRNPAELFRWVATGPGAPKPRNPATEVDDATLGTWAELCTERDWKCDLEIRAGMGMDEVLDTIARCGRATRIEKNGKLSVVIDDVQPAPAQHFTPRNSWGFRSQRRYAAETHALRAQFNNAEKAHQRDEMMVYYPGFDAESAEIVRTVPMIGKTDPAEVYASAKRIIAEELLRPEDYALRADIEHLALKLGQRIAISHPTIAVGEQSARVKALVLNEAETHVVALVLDEEVTQVPGAEYGLIWRSVSGEGEEEAIIAVTEIALENMGDGKGRVVTLAVQTPIASAPKAGDLVTFGEAEIATIDAVVLNIAPSSDLEAEILAAPYNAALFAGDDEEVPAWSSNVSSSAFPAPPAPVAYGSLASADGMFIDFDYPPNEAHRVTTTEAYRRLAGSETARWELVQTLPADGRLATFPAGQARRSYDLQLIAVGARGQRAPGSVITLASETPDPNQINFTAIATDNMTVSGRSITKRDLAAREMAWDDGEIVAWDDGEDLSWDVTGWNGRVYSAEAFTGGVTAIAVLNEESLGLELMFGLSSAPFATTHFSHLNYAWRIDGDEKHTIWGGGELIWDNNGDPEDAAAGNVYSIVYDGAFVRFFVSGVPKFQVSATPSQVFHFSTSFYDVLARLDGVSFLNTGAGVVYTEQRYKRSNAPPAAPTEAEPLDWSVTIPPGEGALYVTSADKLAPHALASPWSQPVLISALNPRGPYDAATTYYREDVVSFGGAYRCIVDETLGNAPSGTAQDNAWWQCIAPPGIGAPPSTPPGAFTATINLAASAAGVNLYELAVAAGYTGHGDSDILFVLPEGVTVTGAPGAPNGGIGIDTGVWPAGYTHDLALRIDGAVAGGGGGGGAGRFYGAGAGFAGGAGGDAIRRRVPIAIEITATGSVRGGGGGGAGGPALETSPWPEPDWARGDGGGGGQPNGPAGHPTGTAGTTSAPGVGGFSAAGAATGGVYGAAGANYVGAPGGAAGFAVRGFADSPVVNNGVIAGAVG